MTTNYPTTLDTTTNLPTKVDNVDTISAAHINNLRDAIIAVETELRITTNRPKFLAYNSATDANVTGDGTAATVDFDTEIFDTGADFASDVFTAPVTGQYLLVASVQLDEIAAGHTVGYVQIVTSNRTYLRNLCNPYAVSTGGSMQFLAVAIADMEAADTAYVQVLVFNSTKVVDVYGAASTRTQFAGALLP